jgi:hypothetical protein
VKGDQGTAPFLGLRLFGADQIDLGVELRLIGRAGDGDGLGGIVMPIDPTSRAWRRYQRSLRLPASAAFVQLTDGLDAGTGPGGASFDDLTLQEGACTAAPPDVVAPPRGRVAVLVVGDGALGAPDRSLKDRLEQMGFDVLLRTGAQVTAADARSRALVVVSDSVTSAQVNTKLRDVRAPLMMLEAGLFDDLGLTGPNEGTHFGETGGQRVLEVRAPAHPLAAGLSGSVAVASEGVTFAWGQPGPGADVVATLAGAPDRASIFAYRTGSAMVGRAAPGRIVGWFAEQTAAASLTDDGWRLFEAAVRWLTAPEALLVVGAVPLGPGDASLGSRLAGLGYEVAPVRAFDLQPADAAEKALVVVSESVTSTDVNTKLRDGPVPTLVLEPALFDDMGFSGPRWDEDHGAMAGPREIDLVDPEHPLAAGLSGRISAIGAAATLGWAKPKGSAEVIATIAGFPELVALFGYRTGRAMAQGLAPARRVGLFAREAASGALTDDGGKLFAAAVRWATQQEALLVVGDEGPLLPGDDAVRARLEALGFDVVTKRGAALNPADAAGKTLAVVSKSTPSAHLGGKLLEARIPVVMMEPKGFGLMKLTGPTFGVDHGEVEHQTTLELARAEHPVGAGLAAGPLAVTAAPARFNWGAPGPDAIRVAAIVGEPARASLFAYRAGDVMVGAIASARRVGFYAGVTASAAMLPSGAALFDAAIRWAAGR